ncbi:unnamed protein product [Toxocara canis]|uniref:Uncharacterized protein n=1 Tax=Toxocara canis TaxID=6265 RepID=A0A183TYZ1_TOXCA|nr:unnamed protein product [Toxocara canis]
MANGQRELSKYFEGARTRAELLVYELHFVLAAIASTQSDDKSPFAVTNWPRPYHVENTTSRPICHVKQSRAWLVLGSETAWESQRFAPSNQPLMKHGTHAILSFANVRSWKIGMIHSRGECCKRICGAEHMLTMHELTLTGPTGGEPAVPSIGQTWGVKRRSIEVTGTRGRAHEQAG